MERHAQSYYTDMFHKLSDKTISTEKIENFFRDSTEITPAGYKRIVLRYRPRQIIARTCRLYIA